jgi:glycosyltransferase involved in cell wall biosynthesis
MKRKLKILIYSYQHLAFNSGGLQEQIKQTKAALEILGHQVYYLDEWFHMGRPKIDICHQFSVHFTLTNTFSELKSLGYPIVVSTVYNEETTFVKYLIRSISKFGIPLFYYRNIQLFLDESNYLITLGKTETKSLINKFNPKTPIVEIPNGISKEIIESDFNLNTDVSYVVCVGTISEIKNQYSLINACHELGVKLILIGPDSRLDVKYVEICKSKASDNVIFTGFLKNTSDEFIKIITQASIFALVSFKEVLPISVFEALALGTPVVCTKNSSVADYFKNDMFIDYCNPLSKKDIIRSIKKQLSIPKSCIINEKIREEFTWIKIAKKVECIYYKTLGL